MMDFDGPIYRWGIVESPDEIILKGWGESQWQDRVIYTDARYVGATRWHQDSDGLREIMALWADRYPTEILVYGMIVVPQEKELVLIKNHKVYHRIPPAVEKMEGVRLFKRWTGVTQWIRSS